MVTKAVRRCTCALGVAFVVIAPAPAIAVEEEIALQCRFSSGLAAIYMFSRGEARVRRVDVLQPRNGRAQATVAEYRFVFDERDSAYRIEVVIDRATGNVRRVFGTRERMERMPERGDRKGGLVYEAGQCRARHTELR